MPRSQSAPLSAAVFLALASSVDGATLHVANTGLDGPGCGPKASPCRSISHAVNTRANDGDSVVVGPGKYGDLDQDGTLGNFPGEETGGFGCMVLIAHAVTLTSSDGAASTLIDGSTVAIDCNVGIAVDGTRFGKPGKGFMVSNTRMPAAGCGKRQYKAERPITGILSTRRGENLAEVSYLLSYLLLDIEPRLRRIKGCQHSPLLRQAMRGQMKTETKKAA